MDGVFAKSGRACAIAMKDSQGQTAQLHHVLEVATSLTADASTALATVLQTGEAQTASKKTAPTCAMETASVTLKAIHAIVHRDGLAMTVV